MADNERSHGLRSYKERPVIPTPSRDQKDDKVKDGRPDEYLEAMRKSQNSNGWAGQLGDSLYDREGDDGEDDESKEYEYYQYEQDHDLDDNTSRRVRTAWLQRVGLSCKFMGWPIPSYSLQISEILPCYDNWTCRRSHSTIHETTRSRCCPWNTCILLNSVRTIVLLRRPSLLPSCADQKVIALAFWSKHVSGRDWHFVRRSDI